MLRLVLLLLSVPVFSQDGLLHTSKGDESTKLSESSTKETIGANFNQPSPNFKNAPNYFTNEVKYSHLTEDEEVLPAPATDDDDNEDDEDSEKNSKEIQPTECLRPNEIKLRPGIITLIVFGFVLVLAVVCVVAYRLGKSRGYNNNNDQITIDENPPPAFIIPRIKSVNNFNMRVFE